MECKWKEPEDQEYSSKCSLKQRWPSFALPSPSSCRTHQSLFWVSTSPSWLRRWVVLFPRGIRRHPTRDVLICSWLFFNRCLRCAWNRVLVFSSPSPPLTLIGCSLSPLPLTSVPLLLYSLSPVLSPSLFWCADFASYRWQSCLLNRTRGSLRPRTTTWTCIPSGVWRDPLEPVVRVVSSEAVFLLACDSTSEYSLPSPSPPGLLSWAVAPVGAASVADGGLPLPWMARPVLSPVSIASCWSPLHRTLSAADEVLDSDWARLKFPILGHFFIPLLATRILSDWKHYREIWPRLSEKTTPTK